MRGAAAAGQVDTGGMQAALVELIRVEGFADADHKFKAEMLEIAGLPSEALPYQEPSADGPADPSRRTQIRQADPNEYERSQF